MSQCCTGSPEHVYISMGDLSEETRKGCNVGSVQLLRTRRTLGDMEFYGPKLSCPAGQRAGKVHNIVGKKWKKVLCRFSCVQLLSLELERAPLQHIAAAKPSSDRQPVGQCAVLRTLGNAASTLLQREEKEKKCPSSFCYCWQKTFLSVHPKNSIT